MFTVINIFGVEPTVLPPLWCRTVGSTPRMLVTVNIVADLCRFCLKKSIWNRHGMASPKKTRTHSHCFPWTVFTTELVFPKQKSVWTYLKTCVPCGVSASFFNTRITRRTRLCLHLTWTKAPLCADLQSNCNLETCNSLKHANIHRLLYNVQGTIKARPKNLLHSNKHASLRLSRLT